MKYEVESFLSKSEEEAVVEAIKTAEKNTSGEIRVHLENNTSKAPFDRALDVFYTIGMDKTKDANGVLIYVATQSRQFAICADKGINDLVKNDFWDNTKNIILNHFKAGNNAKGLIEGILNIGQELKNFFPYQSDDNDELPNEISKG